MWIKFTCKQTYMIKIYVGRVNAVSGESAAEDAGTMLRRQAKLARHYDAKYSGTPLQDYVVVPGQVWLDGIADATGTVRQFVAMPFGSEYSIESQVSGTEAAGGLQFEITPYKPESVLPAASPFYSRPRYVDGTHFVFVRVLDGRTIVLAAHEDDSVEVTKCRIQDKEKIDPSLMRLIYQGKQLQDGRTLADYKVAYNGTLHLALRLLGGFKAPVHEMTVAAGGKIHQTIQEDKMGAGKHSFLPNHPYAYSSCHRLAVQSYHCIQRSDPELGRLQARHWRNTSYQAHKCCNVRKARSPFLQALRRAKRYSRRLQQG